MSRYLLDTELLLWWLNGDDRLPSWGVALLQEPGAEVYVSQVSLWELAEKQATGWLRLAEGLDLAALRAELQRLNLRWLPIADAHLLALADLAPEPERFDPFDRLLVAQARQEPLTLVSGDPAMKRYGATVFPLHRGGPR
ncbi:MAG: type II toxin-antitoxin system VapC family toxin [Cyanobacteriota bacterium]|jgi:PIN domain nuclease of toxin-antitoxin system|nr:type II toxin-antitoxin system VapC family toxin [Cyanobacteriota bacterium]